MVNHNNQFKGSFQKHSFDTLPLDTAFITPFITLFPSTSWCPLSFTLVFMLQSFLSLNPSPSSSPPLQPSPTSPSSPSTLYLSHGLTEASHGFFRQSPRSSGGSRRSARRPPLPVAVALRGPGCRSLPLHSGRGLEPSGRSSKHKRGLLFYIKHGLQLPTGEWKRHREC